MEPLSIIAIVSSVAAVAASLSSLIRKYVAEKRELRTIGEAKLSFDELVARQHQISSLWQSCINASDLSEKRESSENVAALCRPLLARELLLCLKEGDNERQDEIMKALQRLEVAIRSIEDKGGEVRFKVGPYEYTSAEILKRHLSSPTTDSEVQ